MRILIVGDGLQDTYERAIAEELTSLGHVIECFKVCDHLKGIFGRIERYCSTPLWGLFRMERALGIRTQLFAPDVVLIWRGWFASESTIRSLRATLKCHIVLFNNDNPFSLAYKRGNLHQRLLWRRSVSSIQMYDAVLCFRDANRSEYLSYGAKFVRVWRGFYIENLHYSQPARQAPDAEIDSDVTFIGHYENDNRAQILSQIAEEGFRVTVYGGGSWRRALRGGRVILRAPVFGNEYRLALWRSRLATCFLSKLNIDDYTTRNYEVPACGVCLISERTPYLQTVFVDWEEMVFASTISEWVQNARALLADDDLRTSIASRGRARVKRGDFDATSRARELLEVFTELRK
jgi:spore maturation protein CgeB